MCQHWLILIIFVACSNAKPKTPRWCNLSAAPSSFPWFPSVESSRLLCFLCFLLLAYQIRVAPGVELLFNLRTNGKPFHHDSKVPSHHGLVSAFGGFARLHAG